MKSVVRTRAFILAAPAAALLLSGCVGTSTYGTGKTQEEQLYDDLLGIAAMSGLEKKKEPINYLSRPGLVKPPAVAELPAPAETVENQAGYFPSDPEARRQQLLSDLADAEANGGELPPEIVAARRESAERAKVLRRPGAADVRDNDAMTPEERKAAREAFLADRSLSRGASGTAPRKYLTEPPAPYRTPAESAPVGVPGEKEVDPYAKGRKSLFGSIFNSKD
ncbi:hypothetical protein ACFQ14_06950 [Pseudahrensia aquimaris]|uniref:DUF3035 domain-containing protein n=1 Tax=Pseudahrensia aquimaris TaxID=744461 RepID=A0ABW3FH70_9HYPH